MIDILGFTWNGAHKRRCLVVIERTWRGWKIPHVRAGRNPPLPHANRHGVPESGDAEIGVSDGLNRGRGDEPPVFTLEVEVDMAEPMDEQLRQLKEQNEQLRKGMDKLKKAPRETTRYLRDSKQ